MIELLLEEGGTVVVDMAGLITAAEIDDANERLEQSVSVVGAQRVLLDWTRLDGWEKGARAVGTWFGMRHWGSVTKVAILADPKWEDEAMRITDIYKVADVQRFAPDERADAMAWMNEGG